MNFGTIRRISSTTLAAILLAVSAPALPAQDASGQEEQPPANHISSHDRWVIATDYSPDGSLLATAGGQSLHYRPGDVRLWDAASGELVAALEGHPSNVWSVAFSPDGKTLVSTGYDGKVIVWDVDKKESTAVLEKHAGWCRSVAFAPDGEHFATAGEDGTVVIWSSKGPEEVKQLKPHESAVYQVAFSPDGDTLATASTDNSAKLLDWESGKELAKLEGHDDAVWAVAFSADGKLIATAGADRKIHLWSAAGELKTTLVGHKDWVTSVAFSPDGKQLAAADYGRSVKLWDLEAALQAGDEITQALADFKQHSATVEQETTASEDGQKEADSLQEKAEAITAVLDARLLPEELKQAEAALSLAKENRFFREALEKATAAAESAGKLADEKTKAFESDKEFSEVLKKVKDGSLEDAKREGTSSAKAATDAAAKVAAADEKKAAAEKLVAELDAKIDELAEQQYKSFGEFDSSVWTVIYSVDGDEIATGSHKGIQIWDVASGEAKFPREAE